MELQKLDPYGPRSDSLVKLLDDEIDSLVQPSSEIQHQSGENSSEIPQKKPKAGHTGSETRLERSPQDRIKELSSFFGGFYKVMLVCYLVFSAGFLIGLMGLGAEKVPFDIFDFIVGGWALVQAIMAFWGMQGKNLNKMENALMMMKIYFLLVGINSLKKGFEVHQSEEETDELESEGLDIEFFAAIIINISLYTLFIFFPTRKVRNILKSVPQDYLKEVQEIRKEQVQDSDPIERLGSLPFVIYKYGLLLLFLILAQNFLSSVFGASSFLEKIPSNYSVFVSTTMRVLLNPFRMAFLFFAFEGLRRKNLEKIEASIKVLKFTTGFEFVLNVWKEYVWYTEGRLTAENEAEWLLILKFLFKQLMYATGYYLFLMYGALKARDILKAHREAKRTL